MLLQVFGLMTDLRAPIIAHAGYLISKMYKQAEHMYITHEILQQITLIHNDAIKAAVHPVSHRCLQVYRWVPAHA